MIMIGNEAVISSFDVFSKAKLPIQAMPTLRSPSGSVDDGHHHGTIQTSSRRGSLLHK